MFIHLFTSCKVCWNFRPTDVYDEICVYYTIRKITEVDKAYIRPEENNFVIANRVRKPYDVDYGLTHIAIS